MTNLTEKEIIVLKSFIDEGTAVTGAETAADMKEDNMTWMNAVDIQKATGLSKHVVSGVMSSLQSKGFITDSGESPRGAP